MWVETQDGVVVINLETGSYVYLDERKDGWQVILETATLSHILGKYKAEKNAREMLDAFKQKLRRCGEKVFKFKEEAEENDVADDNSY